MKKSALILILKLVVIAGAMTYLFASGRLQLSQLAVETGGWAWIGAAVALIVGWMALTQIRYWVLLRSAGVLVGAGRVVQVGFISWFFNSTLMGGLGFVSGDAIKAGYLIRDTGRGGAIISATLVDRALGVFGLITLAVLALQGGWEEMVESAALRRVAAVLYGVFTAVGLAVFLSAVAFAKGRLAAVVGWLILGGAATVLLVRIWEEIFAPVALTVLPLALAMLAPAFLPGRRLHNAIVNHVWMGNHISAFLTALLDYRKRAGTLLVSYGLSVVLHILVLLALFLTARGISIEHEPTLRQVWFAAPPIMALPVLPLPANGLGVGEAAFDAMLRFCKGPDGNSLEGGAALYLSFRILTTILGLTGLPFYLATRRE